MDFHFMKSSMRDSEKLNLLKRRYQLILRLRNFFLENGYLEVEVPLLTFNPDPEPTLEPVRASYEMANGQTKNAYLTTSPEFYLKRILSEMPEPIFCLTKAFRAHELPSQKHQTEFTIAEWYRPHVNYEYLMNECLKLIQYLTKDFPENSLINPQLANNQAENTQVDWNKKQEDQFLVFNNHKIQLNRIIKISYQEAYQQFSQINEQALFNRDLLTEIMIKKNYRINPEYTLLDLLSIIYVNEIEPNLGIEYPTCIYDFPADQAALSLKKSNDSRYAERFEFYMAGLELANAFTELTSAQEQKQRFINQLHERSATNRNTWPIDEDLIQALDNGLPPTAGIALGVDRLMMILLNAHSIQDVLWFPEKI